MAADLDDIPVYRPPQLRAGSCKTQLTPDRVGDNIMKSYVLDRVTI